VLIAVALAAGTVALYSPAFWFDFVLLDDPTYIVTNQHVLGGLTWPNIVWAFSYFSKGNWIPLTWLSYMADVSIGGTGAGMFHVTNVVLHSANVVLLFGLLLRLTKSLWKSAVVAALFAVHPVHVESVAWVTERKDVLSTFFALLSLHFYARYVERPLESRWAAYAGVAACLVLSLMAKPMMVTLPVLLLLLDVWPLQRNAHWRALVIEKLPFFGIAIAFGVLAIVTQRSAGALADSAALPLGPRLGFAVLGYGAYLWRLVWPAGLNALYAFPEPLPLGWTAAAGAVLIALTGAAIRLVNTRPYVTMGWFWFVIPMAPVSGILQAGQQWTADRYAYVPFIGLYVAIVWVIASLLASLLARVRVAGVALCAVVIVAFGAVTRAQLAYWQNGEVSWKRILATGGDAVRGNIVLGYEASQAGRLPEALEHFEAVLRLQPDHPEATARLAVVHAAMADSAEREGRMAEAVEHYEASIRFGPEAADVQNNYGALLAGQGRAAEALPHFAIAVRVLPNWESARLNYAVALAQTGQGPEAIRQFEEVLRINPSNDVARRALKR
jgi:protein O-mannosyl-transferase